MLRNKNCICIVHIRGNNKISFSFDVKTSFPLGLNCEQRYSECSNQPCLNNGTCLDYDGVTCQCPDGYSGEYTKENMHCKFRLSRFIFGILSGDYCEIDASVCNDTICKNRGECEEGPGFSFFCRCPEGLHFYYIIYY